MDRHEPQVSILAAQLGARVPGGTGRYTEELIRALSLTAPTGASVRALIPRGLATADALLVPTTRLPLPPDLLARLWERGLPPHPARSGVVHAPTLLVPPTREGCALVVTIHDVVPWTHPATLTPRGAAFHQRMGTRAAKQADVIVTPTEVVARQVREILDPRSEVVSIHLGAHPPAPAGDATDRRRRLGLPAAYVMFVGTAEPRKGLDTLVQAMAHPAASALELVVVGPPGWGGVSVSDLATTAGVADRVHVTGRISEGDLQAVYAGAGVVAVPSRAEGFGLPVVEAMSQGVPVVISDDPALMEVGAGAARVVGRDDVDALAGALAESVQDGPARRDVIERGNRRAEAFSWTHTAAQMWAVYRSVDPSA